MRRALPPTLGAWIAIGVLLSALAAYLTARMVTGAHGHAVSHTQPGEAPERDLHAWMHEHLEISEGQWKRLKPFEEVFEKERARLLREVAGEAEVLARAISRGERGDPEIEEALAGLMRAQGALQAITLEHVFEMKEHLNEKQGERLLKWTHDSILRQHQH